MNSFHQLLRNVSLQFTATLYNNKTVSRKYVDNVISETNKFLSKILSHLKEMINSEIKNNNEIVQNTNNFVLITSTCLSMFETEQKRFTQYKTLNTFVNPESYSIGERREYKRKNYTVELIHVPVNAEFIPL